MSGFRVAGEFSRNEQGTPPSSQRKWGGPTRVKLKKISRKKRPGGARTLQKEERNWVGEHKKDFSLVK